MRTPGVIIYFIVLTYSLPAHCQTIKFPAEKSGKLYTCDGYTVTFNKLIILDDSLICYQKGIEIKYANENVCRVDEKGNHIAIMTIVFGGVGLAAGVVVSNAWDEDVLGKPKSFPIILYTSLFTVSGVIVGAVWPKYKTVYSKSRFACNFSPQIYSINNKAAVGLTIRVSLK
ncbi:MAG: hypothetical protein GXO88_10505 [Chlorobi bacterium]|nr:hypothetical protein [Chlorobiota bacterium]